MKKPTAVIAEDEPLLRAELRETLWSELATVEASRFASRASAPGRSRAHPPCPNPTRLKTSLPPRDCRFAKQ